MIVPLHHDAETAVQIVIDAINQDGFSSNLGKSIAASCTAPNPVEDFYLNFNCLDYKAQALMMTHISMCVIAMRIIAKAAVKKDYQDN